MVTSLLRHERITTTTPKAKELKRFADKIITLGKRGTAHARRIAHRSVRDVEVLEKLFGDLAGRFAQRPGGYTRVVRVGRRVGDNAELAVIELVDRPAAAPAEEEKGGKKGKAKEAAPAAAPKAKPEKRPAKAEKAAKEEKPAKAEKAKAEKAAPKAKRKGKEE